MHQRFVSFVGVAALAVAGLLLLAEPASAQRRGRFYGGYSPGTGLDFGYSRGYYGGYPYYYGRGYYPRDYGWYSYPGYSYYPGYYSDYYSDGGTYSGRTWTDSGPANSSEPPRADSSTQYGATTERGAARMNANSAVIDVRVPPNAQVWFEDQPTSQRGSFREFVSPPLEPGRTFSYDIRARWMENGRELERKQHIDVHAGEQLTVNFMARPGTEEIGRPGAR